MRAKSGRSRLGGGGIEAIVGVSGWATRIRKDTLYSAAHDSNVLITGPTGTGKELIARAIHAHSARASGPLVPVDCAALSGDLFLSQMFGHVKGAFTGAHYSALGAFRAADGGTIFLDEIAELEPALQAKLLRVVQEKTVVPLGSHIGHSVDVRIIAATNRDLQQEVRARRFRQDLYYRLDVISLTSTPLRERPEDVDVLANHFLDELAIGAGQPLKRLSPEATDLLMAYDWPGNVRELYNQLERAVIFTEDSFLGPESMPEVLEAVMARGSWDHALCGSTVSPVPEVDESRATGAEAPLRQEVVEDEHWPTIAEVERNHILYTLEHTRYNQTAAARCLQMDRHSLRRKILKFNLDVSLSKRGRPPTRQSSPLPRSPR